MSEVVVMVLVNRVVFVPKNKNFNIYSKITTEVISFLNFNSDEPKSDSELKL